MGSWKETIGDHEILSLAQRCDIKFKSMPIQSSPLRVSKEEERLVDLHAEVQNHLGKRAIAICTPDPNQSIYNIFTIPKDSGTRPTVDMQVLNQLVECLPFRRKYVSTIKVYTEIKDNYNYPAGKKP